MEQIKSRVESQDNSQQRHHTSDEDDNNGMDMDMTNDDHQDSPPPTRAPIRLPGMYTYFLFFDEIGMTHTLTENDSYY